MKQAIAVIMEQEGLTRGELAVRLGVTQGMLSHYSNHQHYPRLKFAAMIYREYKLQVEPFTQLALSDEVERQMQEEDDEH